MEEFGEGYDDGEEEAEEEDKGVEEEEVVGREEREEVGEEFGWDEDGSRKSYPRLLLKCSVIYSIGSEYFLQQRSLMSAFV